MSGVRYVLWDFGDTLADQTWLWKCPDDVPDWTAAYRAVAESGLGASWNSGVASLDQIAAQLSSQLVISVDEVIAHMQGCCSEIIFFPHSWAVASSRSLPQALVTVNPDLFTDSVVPNYRLESVFDAIVTSAEEQSNNKIKLCDVALERLGCPDPSQALLIDNIEANAEAWRERGGIAYWFRGDTEFAIRFRSTGWDGLAAG